VEDRILNLSNKIDIKEKTEESVVKRCKNCERNMKEFSNAIKRANLQIMGIEEGKDVQAKVIHNVLNKKK
jgi:hypothetical protein